MTKFESNQIPMSECSNDETGAEFLRIVSSFEFGHLNIHSNFEFRHSNLSSLPPSSPATSNLLDTIR